MTANANRLTNLWAAQHGRSPRHSTDDGYGFGFSSQADRELHERSLLNSVVDVRARTRRRNSTLDRVPPPQSTAPGRIGRETREAQLTNLWAAQCGIRDQELAARDTRAASQRAQNRALTRHQERTLAP